MEEYGEGKMYVGLCLWGRVYKKVNLSSSILGSL